MSYVKIQTFQSRMEAEIAKSFLSSKGIEATVSADDQGGLRPALSFSNGADLLVDETDAQKALGLLKDKEQ